MRAIGVSIDDVVSDLFDSNAPVVMVSNASPFAFLTCSTSSGSTKSVQCPRLGSGLPISLGGVTASPPSWSTESSGLSPSPLGILMTFDVAMGILAGMTSSWRS